MVDVSIREVAPRDGLQNEEPIPTEAKVRLIDALGQTGVERIEAVSFVHPKAIPQMADADEVWNRVTKNPGHPIFGAHSEHARRSACDRRGLPGDRGRRVGERHAQSSQPQPVHCGRRWTTSPG